MKKSKNKVQIILAVLCLVAVLFSVFGFVPYLRLQVLRVPENTKLLFPVPDEIVVHYGDLAITLNAMESAKIYAACLQLVPKIKDCVRDKEAEVPQYTSENAFYWEFRYEHRYRYVGTLDTPTPFTSRSFTYDALVMSICSDYTLRITRANGGRMKHVDGKGELRLKTDTGFIYDLSSALEGIVMHHMLGGSEIALADENDAVKTDTFVQMPDKVVLCQNGEVVTLGQAEAEEVYGMLSAMAASYTVSLLPPIPHRSVWQSGQQIREVRDKILIGLLYNDNLYYEYQGESKTEEGASSMPVCEYYDERRYDAIYVEVLPLNSGLFHVAAMIGRDGRYGSFTSWHHTDYELAASLAAYMYIASAAD